MSESSRKALFWLSLFSLLIVVLLLATGSSVLLWALSKDPYIPFGTLLTALGMVSFPLLVLAGFTLPDAPSSLDQALTKALKAQVILALLWIPLSYFLSGNLSFTFRPGTGFQGSDLAGKIFWMYSYAMGVIPLVLLAILLIRRRLVKKDQERAT